MFYSLEIHKIDPDYRWMELICTDQFHEQPEVIRLAIDDDHHQMTVSFQGRYMAKREKPFTIPAAQVTLLDEFFQEASMARVLKQNQASSPDLVDLLPTTVINFKYTEKTTFRKSRAARTHMFLEEAMLYLRQRKFEPCLKRLNWVHILEPSHELAFELKIVCLRSSKKWADCIPIFEQWIKQHPHDIGPQLGLSEMWLYLDQNQKAAETFQHLLDHSPKCGLAMIGLAQAKLKLGDDPLPFLRKAWFLDTNLTRLMLENAFDFRGKKEGELQPLSLKQIASHYQIPLKRVLNRAKKGVLPMYPAEEAGQLFRFRESDLNRHYQILQKLGVEIGSECPTHHIIEPKAVQPSLFEEESFSEETEEVEEPSET